MAPDLVWGPSGPDSSPLGFLSSEARFVGTWKSHVGPSLWVDLTSYYVGISKTFNDYIKMQKSKFKIKKGVGLMAQGAKIYVI
jgi:hypothetical protein